MEQGSSSSSRGHDMLVESNEFEIAMASPMLKS